ncbi:MAG: thiamine biosynthesis lipoprotein ApbE [Moraxellaceae bacterium]|nr:thiamine biosynthesis lipoprotein ApbE [Moraxellaceae bacterium]
MRRVLIPLQLDESQSPPAGAEVFHWQGRTMGTTWSVRVAGPRGLDEARLQGQLQALLDGVVREMSPWEADSVISRFNRAAAGSWQALPADFFQVLQAALALARDSDGAFDPAIGALVNLWGFGPAGRRDDVPVDADIAAARAVSGWQQLVLDEAAQRVQQPGGLQLDFSGIAKGFAVDKLADFLRGLGLHNHLVEVGGELRGAGLRPDGHPWWVALESPPGAGSEDDDTIVALHELAIATSGDYRKFFSVGTQRYAHTLDPRTGRPLAGALTSVTVLHASCMMADAEATALYVLGPEQGLLYAEARGLAVRFLQRQGDTLRETMTTAMAAMLD